MALVDDYVLGTHDVEIARLGLQHQVWRGHMLQAWMRAGMTRGSRVIDFGAGPGFASFDAAEIVGPHGGVVAIERSQHFLKFAGRELERLGANRVRLVEADLMRDDFDSSGFDIAWCRWVASFVTSPAILVEKVFGSLRVGGRAVFHEYQSYATWRMIPTSHRIDNFVQQVMASWRDSGGEPDIVPTLVPIMNEAGFKIIELRPLIFAVRPADFMWQWPAAFIESNSQRLVDLGKVSQQWAHDVQAEFIALSANPDAILVTPVVMEVIAQRLR
ncbi:MAG: class I SAM-dependent methyltransferase [Steroidobacteraceae bacterium]|jgi:ubiquinone/menaquinone biosynthesis C-methylase UbiE